MTCTARISSAIGAPDEHARAILRWLAQMVSLLDDASAAETMSQRLLIADRWRESCYHLAVVAAYDEEKLAGLREWVTAANDNERSG